MRMTVAISTVGAALLTIPLGPGLQWTATAWSQTQPAEGQGVRIFKGNDEGLREVMPGTFVKHMYGKDISIALFKIIRKKGTNNPPVSPHIHGEEAAVFLKGKGKWRVGGREYRFEPGDVFCIPAGLEHGGADADLEGEEVVVLSVVTPPLKELGLEGAAENPYRQRQVVSEQTQPAAPAGDPERAIRIFKTNDEGLREVMPGTFIKHIYTEKFSIALFKIQKGVNNPPVPPHTHGEEAALIFKGKGTGRFGGKDYDFAPGDVIYVPAGVPHGGGGSNLAGEESIVLGIITPPRREYGPEGAPANPYQKLR